MDSATEGNRWILELRFDGYCCLISTSNCSSQAFIRFGLDWTDKFKPIPEAAKALPSKSVLNDGKVVVIDADGRTNFQRSQSAIKTEPQGWSCPLSISSA